MARIIGLLSLILGLAGCSALKLGYATLPEVAWWWLDGYVDLEDAQARRVREDLQRVHAWHRVNELPKLVALLQRMEQIAPRDTTAAEVCSFEGDLRQRYVALRERAEPAIVTTMLDLRPEHAKQVERRFARNNREFEKDWIRSSPAEQTDKRTKMLVERLETLYGDVSEGQRAVIAQHLQASPFPAAQVLAERKRRQQDTLAVMRRFTTEQVSLADARSAVHGLLERMTESPDAAYRAYQVQVGQDFCRVIAAVHNAANPAQREHAARRLRGWQRDLSELSAAP